MAFYTMFALGPIMIFSIAVAEPFVGRLMAQEAIFKALETVVAPEQLKGIQRFATQDLFKGGGIAALIGAVVLLYTGTRVFVELDDGIDAIWRDRKTRSLHPVLASLKSRLLALALMVVLGLLLIAVILASVLLSAYAGALEAFPILGEWIGPAMSASVHYGLLSAFFTLIYKWLPTGGVPWRYALIGGARECPAVRRGQPCPRLLLRSDAAYVGVRRHRRFRRHHDLDVLDIAHHPDRRPGRALDARRADRQPQPRDGGRGPLEALSLRRACERA